MSILRLPKRTSFDDCGRLRRCLRCLNLLCRHRFLSFLKCKIVLCFYYTQKEKLCQYAERGVNYAAVMPCTWQAVHQGALMRKTAFSLLGNIPNPLAISENLATHLSALFCIYEERHRRRKIRLCLRKLCVIFRSPRSQHTAAGWQPPVLLSRCPAVRGSWCCRLQCPESCRNRRPTA